MELGRKTGTVDVRYSFGEHPLSRDDYTESISLSAIDRAKLFDVGGQPLVRFGYEDELKAIQGRMFLVPTEWVQALQHVLSEHGVTFEDKRTETWRVRRRLGSGILTLGLLPLAAGYVWPAFVFSTPLLFILVFAFVWLAVKGYSGLRSCSVRGT
jgi:hypothetical protein